MPPPCEDDAPCWDPSSRQGYVAGNVYTDGSLMLGTDEQLARAGYGVAMIEEVGAWVARFHGAFCGSIQCIDAAELFAATQAIKNCHQSPSTQIAASSKAAGSVDVLGAWLRGGRMLTFGSSFGMLSRTSGTITSGW